MKRLSLLLCLAALPSLALDWPQWRGPERTDLSKETGLLKTWPAEGPGKLWVFKNAGLGYGGFAVVGGKVYTLGLRDKKEYLVCVDAAKGTELWSTAIADSYDNSKVNTGWGDGPRGTPTIHEGHAYVLGANGDLACLTADTGRIVWQKSLLALGGSTPTWGYAESPLVVDDKLIVTPGGKDGALAALDLKTGEVKWRSTEFTDPAHYSSVILAKHAGKKMLVQLVEKNAVGIDADNGKLLWKTDWPGKVAVIPTPIHHAGRVFISSGYGVGCKVVEIGNDFSVTQKWMNKNIKNHHGGVILHEGHLYGYSDGIGWTCVDFETGEQKWSNKDDLGKGAIAYADGMFYCLDEASGKVVLIKATPDGWSPAGEFKLEPQTLLRNPQGRIWTHPVISGGKLFLRDQEIVVAYNISKS